MDTCVRHHVCRDTDLGDDDFNGHNEGEGFPACILAFVLPVEHETAHGRHNSLLGSAGAPVQWGPKTVISESRLQSNVEGHCHV